LVQPHHRRTKGQICWRRGGKSGCFGARFFLCLRRWRLRRRYHQLPQIGLIRGKRRLVLVLELHPGDIRQCSDAVFDRGARRRDHRVERPAPASRGLFPGPGEGRITRRGAPRTGFAGRRHCFGSRASLAAPAAFFASESPSPIGLFWNLGGNPVSNRIRLCLAVGPCSVGRVSRRDLHRRDLCFGPIDPDIRDPGATPKRMCPPMSGAHRPTPDFWDFRPEARENAVAQWLDGSGPAAHQSL